MGLPSQRCIAAVYLVVAACLANAIPEEDWTDTNMLENYLHKHIPHHPHPKDHPHAEAAKVSATEPVAEEAAEPVLTREEAPTQERRALEAEMEAQPSLDTHVPPEVSPYGDAPRRRLAYTGVPGAQLATNITNTMAARLAAAKTLSASTLATNKQTLESDRTRIQGITTANVAAANSNRNTMATTKTNLASARTAVTTDLASKAASVLSARNAAKTAATSAIAAVSGRHSARMSAQAAEQTRITNQLNTLKSTHTSHKNAFNGERTNYVAAHKAQADKLAATPGHAGTAAEVIASRTYVSASV